jgi:anti-anti-sigma factor
MKRQATTSGIGNKARKEVKLADRGRIARRAHVGPPTQVAAGSNGNGNGRPSLSLAPESLWSHTLELAGELNLRSARTLEAEIEHLCEEGVTRIVLDLRRLTRIDAIGVAVISFRSGHCTRHGYGFALIPGAPSIQLAFEQAGVLDSLPFVQPTELAAGEPRRRYGDELDGSGAGLAGGLADTERGQAHDEAGMARGQATSMSEQSV